MKETLAKWHFHIDKEVQNVVQEFLSVVGWHVFSKIIEDLYDDTINA